MAVVNENRATSKETNMNTAKNPDKKVYLVAQELKFAKVLAGNDPKARDRAIKNLKAWFAKRTETMPFTQEDFQRIWKGLFYSMWMSDKPLVQEECAENISKLVHFPTVDTSLMFFEAGMIILNNEWFGIDQLRLDKFLMLVRRLLRQTFFAIKNKSFNLKNIQKFNKVLSETILNPDAQPPLGLFMHFIDIFMEELAKVSEGKIDPNLMAEFVKPFINKMITLNDGRLLEHIRKNIFTYLLRQSDLGLEYQAKYEAWKQQGFPGHINSMQKVKLAKEDRMLSDDDEEEEEREDEPKEKPLDPRAGRVDVELPQIKFNAKKIAKELQDRKFDKNSTTKSRKTIDMIARQFTKLANGQYPIGAKQVKSKEDEQKINIRKEAKKLIKFDQKLLRMGQPKRKLDNESLDDNDEEEEVSSKRTKYENGESNDSSEEDSNDTDENLEEDSSDNSEEDSDNNETVENNINQLPKVNRGGRAKTNQNKTNGGVTKVSKKKTKININDMGSSIEENRKLHKKNAKIQQKINGKSKLKKQTIIDNIECIFERNSGTWVVFDVTNCDKNETAPSALSGDTQKAVVIETVGNLSKSSGQKDFETHSNLQHNPSISGGSIKKSLSDTSNTPLKMSPPKTMLTVNSTPKSSPVKSGLSREPGTPKSGPISPVQAAATDSSDSTPKCFPINSPWDEPLKDGEYEICIPSRKYLAKQKEILGETKAEVLMHSSILNKAIQKIKGKGRRSSLDPNLLRDPFGKPGNSEKKVKINTKLNRSQEVHEHHMQVLRSPAIPYDASKQPTKPLLKTRVSTTPINPFYNRKLSIW